MVPRTRAVWPQRLRLLVPVLALALLAGACTSDPDPQTTDDPTTATSGPSGSGTGTGTAGPGGVIATGQAGPAGNQGNAGADRLVGVRLSEGVAAPTDPVSVVEGEELPADRIKAIIDRLSPWTDDDGELTEKFRWPTQTIRPPAGGTTVDQPFPPEGGGQQGPTDPGASGPLKVLRYQPEGPVAVAPFASITFNQPMVPVGTVGQVSALDVPATITPEVPGHWEWIGTQTLRFVGDSDGIDRLPMATDYTITVPAGTTSATGGKLAEAVTIGFSTPAVSVKSFGPKGSGVTTQPVFVAVFDQLVDADAVLATTTLEAGDTVVPIRRATQAEVDADEAATQALSEVPDGRWLAFRAEQPLPTNTAFTVTFAEGTPSVEGPATTAKPIAFTGRTYAPLTLSGASCKASDCEPGGPIELTFSNVLDPKAFDADDVTVSPELPGLSMQVYDKVISIQGDTQPGVTYTITVPADVTDVHGQQLGSAQTKTVTFGPGRPRLTGFAFPLTTLDPLASGQTLTVNSVRRTEFRLRVFSVSPDDWMRYRSFYSGELWSGLDKAPVVPDWPVLTDENVAIDDADGTPVATIIDLSDELDRAGTGHVVVLVEPTAKDAISRDDWWSNQPTATWVQATTIGLDAWADPDELRFWATDLRTGAPISGASVAPLGGEAVTTGDDGTAGIPLSGRKIYAVVATHDGQTAILPADMWMSVWQSQPVSDELRWFVNDDRQTYRPGETVSLKGWVRMLDEDAQLQALGDDSRVTYTVTDPMGNQLATGTADVGRLGGFDFTVDLPAGAALGPASVELRMTGSGVGVDNGYYGYTFTIADFRTPDYEVDVHPSTPGPYLADSPFTVDADAAYYAGGPLGAAGVDWQVRTAPASYSPPGWDTFTFGVWTPWWLDYGRGYGDYEASYGRGYGYPMPDDDAVVEEFSGVTDAQGAHHLQVQVGDLGEDNDGLPATVTAQATVTDLNRQAIAGTTDVLVHPADYYVGLSGGSTFVRKGDPLTVSAIVTDIDGRAAAGRQLQLRAVQVTTTWVDGQPTETESDTGVQSCSLTSTTEPVSCTFRPEVGGSYRITATVTDDAGRHSRSQLTRWVSGGGAQAARYVEREQLTLIPGAADYAPGDTATVLVLSPIETGTGMLTVSRVGVTSTSTFQVTDGSAELQIPVADTDIPTINLSVEVVGTSPRLDGEGAPLDGAAPRPAFATGELSLAVSTASRELDVTATPRETTVAPGGSTVVDVTVLDADGKPVSGSEFELVVVDEAVLALGGYQPIDPLATFYPAVYSRVQATYGRTGIALGQTGPPNGTSSAAETSAKASAGTEFSYDSDGGAEQAAPLSETASAASRQGAAAAGPQIPERSNFDPLAVFEPSVTTDADGKASVEVDLPDNLTRYRVLAVAVDGADRFGTAESNLTAGLPLTVRPTAPRFLNYGDTFELPVLVQNTGTEAMDVDVVVQTANLAVGDRDGSGSTTADRTLTGKQVTVPAGDRVEVRFPLSAAEVGTAKLRVAAVTTSDGGGAGAADAAVVELPVYTPATSETFAGYGIVDSDKTVAQPLLAPDDVIAEFGGLQVSTSSTALATLTDAVLYLTDYEYESSDGLASQVLAIATLGEVLSAFQAPGVPSPETQKAAAQDKIKQLVAMQNDDGGFSYWRRGQESAPFNTVMVTQALAVAAEQGFTVDSGVLDQANSYLKDIRSKLHPELSEQDKDTIEAYALNVRMAGGDRDATRANALVADRGVEELPLDALAWLWPVVDDADLAAAIDARVNRSAVDTAGAVTFTDEVADGDWTLLRSDRRTDALLLDALVRLHPDSDLVPKSVAGLLAAQVRGRWDNVQENTFALVALKHYYDTFEADPADFVAKVWLGERFAGQHAFEGHSDETTQLDIPIADLQKAGDTAVTLNNDGTGRLYYRIGLQTAPEDLTVDPLDRGFVVARTYEAVDDPEDVTRDADGTWRIKAGALVRVKLAMVARSERTGVALIDPLPAGLEILNPDLETTPEDLTGEAQSTDDGGDPGDVMPYRYSWWGTWYDHENLRDDRAEAYASYLPAGDFEYRYLARATTPGSFVVPPTRAEEMYAPETFGRAGSDRVVVVG